MVISIIKKYWTVPIIGYLAYLFGTISYNNLPYLEGSEIILSIIAMIIWIYIIK